METIVSAYYVLLRDDKKSILHLCDICTYIKSGSIKLGMKCLAIPNFFPQSMKIGIKSVEKGRVNAHLLDLLSILSD